MRNRIVFLITLSSLICYSVIKSQSISWQHILGGGGEGGGIRSYDIGKDGSYYLTGDALYFMDLSSVITDMPNSNRNFFIAKLDKNYKLLKQIILPTKGDEIHYISDEVIWIVGYNYSSVKLFDKEFKKGMFVLKLNSELDLVSSFSIDYSNDGSNYLIGDKLHITSSTDITLTIDSVTLTPTNGALNFCLELDADMKVSNIKIIPRVYDRIFSDNNDNTFHYGAFKLEAGKKLIIENQSFWTKELNGNFLAKVNKTNEVIWIKEFYGFEPTGLITKQDGSIIISGVGSARTVYLDNVLIQSPTLSNNPFIILSEIKSDGTLSPIEKIYSQYGGANNPRLIQNEDYIFLTCNFSGSVSVLNKTYHSPNGLSALLISFNNNGKPLNSIGFITQSTPFINYPMISFTQSKIKSLKELLLLYNTTGNFVSGNIEFNSKYKVNYGFIGINISTHSISVNALPVNSGQIIGTGNYIVGQVASLNALPSPGYIFKNWVENNSVLSVNPLLSLTVDNNRALEAIFLQRFNISVSVNPLNSGSVTGGGTYSNDEFAKIKAIPNSGYKFIGWYENNTLFSTLPEIEFKVNSNRSIYAHFELIPRLQISPLFVTVPFSAGNSTIEVSNVTGGTMSWTATSNVSWIIIASGSSGTNNGKVNFNYLSNAGDARVGKIIIKSIGAYDSPIDFEVRQDKFVSVEKYSDLIPIENALKQNYPNPFNPSTNIQFDIAKESFVMIRVYDVLGNELETLVNQNLPPANYSIKFDATKYNNGIYFYKLDADGFSQTRKMILLK